jgi:hypothetical protein
VASDEAQSMSRSKGYGVGSGRTVDHLALRKRRRATGHPVFQWPPEMLSVVRSDVDAVRVVERSQRTVRLYAANRAKRRLRADTHSVLEGDDLLPEFLLPLADLF